MAAKTKGTKPKREAMITSIQVAAHVTVFEDGKAIESGVFGSVDENGHPRDLLNIDQLIEWAKQLPSTLQTLESPKT
jgi:hypothetical protein